MKFGKILLSLILILASSTSFAYDFDTEERVSLGFLYGWTGNVDLIDRTKGGINQVSPTCLDLDNKGNLVVTGNLTHEFVTKMHERGILVTPFLSNHWVRSKGVNAVNNAEALSDQIANTIAEYDLDGINVDIENLTPEHRDLLSNFVALLNDKIDNSKILSVSVAANPFGVDTGWQGSYDYKALAENSDYIMLMAYDEHSQGGAVGPVSSHAFTENSIIYARDYVEKDKLVLGIPFFGRYWKYDEEEDTYKGGNAIVMGGVQNVLSKYEPSVDNINELHLYDENIGEASLKLFVNNEEISYLVNGYDLEDGEYMIWYPNHAAIKDKLDLVNKYDLLGAGVWALGQEKVEVWDYYYDELNKTKREVTPAPIVVEEIAYEAITVDTEPLNREILRLRSIPKPSNANSIDSILQDDTLIRNKAPHLESNFIREVKFVKTKANVEKDKVAKMPKVELPSKSLHFKRYEKIW